MSATDIATNLLGETIEVKAYKGYDGNYINFPRVVGRGVCRGVAVIPSGNQYHDAGTLMLVIELRDKQFASPYHQHAPDTFDEPGELLQLLWESHISVRVIKQKVP